MQRAGAGGAAEDRRIGGECGHAGAAGRHAAGGGGTTDSLYISPESSAITVAGTPAAGDMVFFRIARVATDGADTLAVDARLHGITLFINTSALTDA